MLYHYHFRSEISPKVSSIKDLVPHPRHHRETVGLMGENQVIQAVLGVIITQLTSSSIFAMTETAFTIVCCLSYTQNWPWVVEHWLDLQKPWAYIYLNILKSLLPLEFSCSSGKMSNAVIYVSISSYFFYLKISTSYIAETTQTHTHRHTCASIHVRTTHTHIHTHLICHQDSFGSVPCLKYSPHLQMYYSILQVSHGILHQWISFLSWEVVSHSHRCDQISTHSNCSFLSSSFC